MSLLQIKNGFMFVRHGMYFRVTKLKKDGCFTAVFDCSDCFAFISHISTLE